MFLSLPALLLASAAALPAAAPPADAQVTADDVVVTGQKPRDQASAGTKSDTPIAETPQSISVVSGADVAALGLQSLNQALRYVAGVTPEQRGAAAEVFDQFSLRGFTAPRYLDGLRVFNSPTGYADAQVDVSRVDRYEIVKGPASVLYGQSSPGGLVAIESKLPLARDSYGAVAGTYGGDDLYRVDADVGGRVGGGRVGADLAYRLYGSVNGADTQARFGKRRRETASAAVTAGAGTPTSFTLLAAYSHDPYNGNYGVHPASGTFFANPNGRVPTSFYGGEPGDRFRREQAALTGIFRHAFGGDWVLRASGRYQYVSSALGLHYVSGYPTDAAQRVNGRASYATREQLNSWTFDNRLTGSVTTGALKQTFLFGVDRLVLHGREDFAFGGATPIDLYAPTYGTTPTIAPGDVAAVPPGPFGPFAGAYAPRVRQQGVYAQDQLALGGARLTLSGRHDWARTALYGPAQKDAKWTYRVGALYLLPSGLAPYASYATSFEPQVAAIGVAPDQTNARPSIGRQVEAGLKYQLPGTPALLTASAFRIEQSNVVTSNPLTFVSDQSGKVRSRGVEVEASAPLRGGFNARLAWSRQKVRVIADDNPARVGGKLFGVGKGNATAFLEWAPRTGPLAGFAIGGDVRHVDKVYSGGDTSTAAAGPYIRPGGYEVPSYTVLDALARLDLGRLSPRLAGVSLQVNAANLLDRKYLTSCYLDYATGWCWYGNRRTVQGTVAYRW